MPCTQLAVTWLTWCPQGCEMVPEAACPRGLCLLKPQLHPLSSEPSLWICSRNPTDFLVWAAFSYYLPGTGMNPDPGEMCTVVVQLPVTHYQVCVSELTGVN